VFGDSLPVILTIPNEVKIATEGTSAQNRDKLTHAETGPVTGLGAGAYIVVREHTLCSGNINCAP